MKWNRDVKSPRLCDISWLELVFHFRKFSGLDIGLSVARWAYYVWTFRNVNGNELAKPAPIFAQIRMIANTRFRVGSWCLLSCFWHGARCVFANEMNKHSPMHIHVVHQRCYMKAAI